MEIIKAIDLVLQNIFVRWVLLSATTMLLIISAYQLSRIGIYDLQLKAAQGSISEYAAAAKESERQRIDLEDKIKQAAIAVDVIKKEYDTRIEKINKTKITSATCSGMIAESLKILQEGQQ